MLALTSFEFIVRVIPESFLIILSLAGLSKIKIDVNKYIISSLLLGISIYIIRLLPINYGVHTILNIIIMTSIICTINKADIILGIKASIISTILLFICEGLNMLVLSIILKDNLELIMLNVISKTLYGYPSLILFGVISLAYYFKKRDMNYVKN